MKRFIPLLFIIPALSFGAPFDILINQRNIADTATLGRVMPLPAQNISSIMGIDQYTNLPALFAVSYPLGIINGQLTASTVWGDILNKPVFSAVATSGDYNDLSNKPSIGAQVNSDWLAASGAAEIMNKPSLAAVATSGAYSDLSGAPSIPAAQVQTDWNASTGLGELLNKPSTFTPSAHNQAWSTITSTPTTMAGYGIADGATLTDLATKFATPSGSTSQYVRGDGSLAAFPSLNAGTVTSVTAGTGLSGGAITTSGTISMPSVGTAGSYSGLTTDAQGRVTAGTNRSQASATRSLNSVFQVSATRDSSVQYSVQITITASISGGQDGDVFLDIASDSGFTTNVQSLDVAPCSQSYTLAIALQGVQKCAAQVRGYIPAGYYARIRTVNNVGSPAYLFRLAQEVLQ